jgi:hypothetical protein
VIVGSSRFVTPQISLPGTGFVFDGTSMFDLNDVIIPDEGKILPITAANAIDNAGQIAAEGGSADPHALVLTPRCVPAPPMGRSRRSPSR